MLKLSLDAIQVIDSIERFGSFSAAAEHLHKVPSTISYTVTKLEEQLGMELFERHGPRVVLTRVGEELLKEGRWLVAAAGDLESRLRRIATGYESELRFVHDSIISSAAFIGDVVAFEALKCGTRLHITSEVMTGSWEALKEGRADLILAVGAGPAGGDFKMIEVGTLEFVFCVGRTHPLAKRKKKLSNEDLREHTAIAVADSARVLPARTTGLLSGQNRITVPDMAAKIAFQKAGLGHGFLPRMCIRKELKDKTLVELAVEDSHRSESFCLAWRPKEDGEALKWWRTRLARPLTP
jgi:DNA-binding transcriptional LysR family regulator